MSALFDRRSFLGRAGTAGLLASVHNSLAYGASAAVHDRYQQISANKVRVGGAIGERIDLTWKGNILKLDVDRDFIGPFLDKTYSTRITGDFVGLGMFTDALVRLAFYTGDPALLALKKRVISAILRFQEGDGYIGRKPPAKRIREPWDVHELNYIVYGLTTDYRLFGEKSSLAAARRGADYLVNGLRGKVPGAVDDSKIHLAMVITGFDRTMVTLHAVTGEQRYLDILNDVGFHTWDLDIVEGRKSPFYGHVYCYLSRSLAQVELYHRTGNKALLAQTGKAMDFLRKRNGLLVTGAQNKIECWHSDQSGAGEIGETCATAYFVRILDQLQRMHGDSLYGDMMERTIYNTLFGAMSPDGRKLRYWTPFEGPRAYYGRDYMCCPGNFRRIISELPSMVYYSSADGGAAVNLYTESSAELSVPRAGNVRISQVTDYPNSGDVQIHIDPQNSVAFPVKLRVPRWCQSARLAMNGRPVGVDGPGFVEVWRKWKKGDVLELQLQMPWRLVRGRQSQEGRVAVLRGPSVYCLNPERNQALSGKDLKQLTLDPNGFQPMRLDDAIRSKGTAVEVAAWSGAVTGQPDCRLTLTEFPDPGGQATYFSTSKQALTMHDELIEV